MVLLYLERSAGLEFYEWICFSQIRDLEAEVFRLLKQNGTQVNNNNNIFERRTSLGEVSKGDTMENLDVKQTSCQDGLSQGLFNPTTKIIFHNCVIGLLFFFFWPRDLKVGNTFLLWERRKGLSKQEPIILALILSKINTLICRINKSQLKTS